MDHYAALEVPDDADETAIKKAPGGALSLGPLLGSAAHQSPRPGRDSWPRESSNCPAPYCLERVWKGEEVLSSDISLESTPSPFTSPSKIQAIGIKSRRLCFNLEALKGNPESCWRRIGSSFSSGTRTSIQKGEKRRCAAVPTVSGGVLSHKPPAPSPPSPVRPTESFWWLFVSIGYAQAAVIGIGLLVTARWCFKDSSPCPGGREDSSHQQRLRESRQRRGPCEVFGLELVPRTRF